MTDRVGEGLATALLEFRFEGRANLVRGVLASSVGHGVDVVGVDGVSGVRGFASSS